MRGPGPDILSMDEDEELQLGELIFALHLSWLDNPIKAEDLASLAVKASLALQLNGGGEKCFCICGYKRIDQVIKFNSRRVECGEMETVGDGRSPGGSGGGGGCDVEFVVKRKEGNGGGRRGEFTTKLSVILEEYDQNLEV